MLNSGSSSVKFQLIDPDSGASLADGIVERIGEDASTASLTVGDKEATRDARVADHEAALRTAFDLFDEAGTHLDTVGLIAVGHRVVHGGPDLYRPTLVDDALIGKLEELAPLAPLHNPPAVLGIRGSPQGATRSAAHRGVRHRVLSRPAAGGGDVRHRSRHRRAVAHPSLRLSRHVAPVRQRAGGGVSRRAAGQVESDRAAPRQRGVGVGDRRRTPGGHLDGADADGGPGDGHPLRRYRSRRHHLPVAHSEHERRGHRVDAQPTRRRAAASAARSTSGCCTSASNQATKTAQLAYDVYIHRLRKYIGAYLALLGTADVITFTAGVGENDAAVRRDALSGMAALGIELDEHLNASPARAARRISADSSPTTVLVVPTNEELAIARALRRAWSTAESLGGSSVVGIADPQEATHLWSDDQHPRDAVPSADHVDVVQGRKAGGAEEVDRPSGPAPGATFRRPGVRRSRRARGCSSRRPRP